MNISCHRDKSGAALISTVLLTSLLILLATSMSVYVAKKATSVDILKSDLGRDVLLDSALQFGMGRVFSTRPGVAISGTDKIRLHAGEAKIEWVAETARININMIDQTYFKSILELQGLASDQATSLSKLVIARRNLNVAKPIPKEYQIFKDRPIGPYTHVRDLLDVPGMTSDLFSNIVPLLTVYGKSAKIDPRLADPDLLRALPDVSEPQIKDLLNLRNRSDEDAQTQLSVQDKWAQYLGFERSPITRFKITMTLESKRVETWDVATIHFPDDDRAFRVLSMIKIATK